MLHVLNTTKNMKNNKFQLLPLTLFLGGCGSIADFLDCVGGAICTFESGATLTGGSGNDKIIGFTGDDVISGGDGDDTIKGYRGNDIISGGNGNDLIFGGSGNDTIEGDDGADTIYGDEGDDIINGGSGDDSLFGGTGNDTISGGVGLDRLYGNDGNDIINFELANEIADGGEVNDTLFFVEHTNNLGLTIDFANSEAYLTASGPSGQKNIYNFEAFDTVLVNDFTILGNTSTTEIKTAAGDDTITSIGIYDVITSGDGSDVITKISGGGEINSGAGNDRVTLQSNQRIEALLGAGDDTLVTSVEFEELNGEDGIDTLVISNAWTFENIIISLADNAVYSTHPDVFTKGLSLTVLNFENITVEDDAPVTLIGDDQVNSLVGGWGSDTIDGGAGADSLTGGAGDDTLVADDADTLVDGGAGADTLQLADDATYLAGELANIEIVELVADAEITVDYTDVTGANNIATVTGMSAGEEVEKLIITGASHGAGIVTLNYSASNLTLRDVMLEVNGGSDGEVITGTSGADDIDGGDGADTVTGGAGADVLTGGDGADTFVFATTDSSVTTTTADVILDYLTATDILKVGTNGSAANFFELDADASTGDDINTIELAVAVANAAVGAGTSFDGTVQFMFVFDATGGVDGYLVADNDLDGSADFAIELTGLNAAGGVLFGDIVA